MLSEDRLGRVHPHSPCLFFNIFMKNNTMKKQPLWKIILVIIIAVFSIIFLKNYTDKVTEEAAQRAVDKMMEIKKQAAEKDTIPLVPAKKIDSL